MPGACSSPAEVGGVGYLMGNRRLLAEHGIATGAFEAAAARLEGDGRTLSWLAEGGAGGRLLGFVAFGDKPKQTARQAVEALHQRGSGP